MRYPSHNAVWRNRTRTLCENNAKRSLYRCKPADPSSRKMPLAEAKALVDDPAGFTREMTRILLAKQSTCRANDQTSRKWCHPPQVAQLAAPTATNTPAPVSPCSSSSVGRCKYKPWCPLLFYSAQSSTFTARMPPRYKSNATE